MILEPVGDGRKNYWVEASERTGPAIGGYDDCWAGEEASLAPDQSLENMMTV